MRLFWYAFLFMLLYFLSAVLCLRSLVKHLIWWNRYHNSKLKIVRIISCLFGMCFFTMGGVLCCVGGWY